MFNSLFQALRHLPVSDIAESVASHYVTQSIPVVTSEVASGKTMLLPAHCAALLADDPVDPVVYVLEPTRFLANNAAESLRSLLGKEGENLIGCLNAQRSDEVSITHDDNRVVFTTVGYALSAGILAEAHNFILDEAHETSIELSLTKAYLQHRRAQGDPINVAVLSATIDVTNEMDYWGDDAVHFSTKGSAFPVEFFHRPAFSLAESVLTLVRDHDRHGILVFVSGLEEIEEAGKEIGLILTNNGVDYEIATIHGGSSGHERKIASQKRRCDVKVLIGTNVLESGVSLDWVDSGVSSGDTKVMHANGNVRHLKKEELPQWRIHQQMGRVGRFKPGVFILAHHTSAEMRPNMALADIVRLPLTELVMHCCNYPDIHIHDLRFTAREQPKPEALAQAIRKLVDYGLIEECEDGRIVLTDDGRLIQPLPLSYRAAAALCEAYHMGRLAEMLPLITIMDIGDMRATYKYPMSGAEWSTSDLVHQVMVITRNVLENDNVGYQELMDLAFGCNLSIKKYREYIKHLRDLEKKTQTRADFTPYHAYGMYTEDEAARVAWDQATKQVIMRSMSLETYPYVAWMQAVKTPSSTQDGFIYGNAQMSNTTVCVEDMSDQFVMCSGDIRVITPKKGRPFAVLQEVTAFTESDLAPLVKRFGRKTLEKIAAISTSPTKLSEWLTPKPVQTDSYGKDEYYYGNSDDYGFGSSHQTSPKKSEPYREAPELVPEKVGTFGDLLGSLLKK